MTNSKCEINLNDLIYMYKKKRCVNYLTILKVVDILDATTTNGWLINFLKSFKTRYEIRDIFTGIYFFYHQNTGYRLRPTEKDEHFRYTKLVPKYNPYHFVSSILSIFFL